MSSNASDLITRGAHGDPEALSGLVDWAFDRFQQGHVTWAHATHVAEAFARMAAVHGKPSQILRLAACLFFSAEREADAGRGSESVLLQAEAVSVLNKLADAGDEEAAQLLMTASPQLTPGVVAMAAQYDRQNEDIS